MNTRTRLMAKYRTPNTALSKTCERTSALIYLVGYDRTIIYANPATAMWAGVDPEAMFGSVLIYSSEELPREIENRLKGLCPPAELFDDVFLDEDRRCEFYLSATSSAKKASTQPVWRAAIGFRIDDPDEDEFSVLVVSFGDDLDSLPIHKSDRGIVPDLHVALAQVRQQSQLSHRMQTLVGVSPTANRIRRVTKFAAESAADVLIAGPPGSGKEHLARTIHANGNDALKTDIVPVQCDVADQELLQHIIQELLKKNKTQQSFEKNKSRDVLLLLNIDRLNYAAQIELWGFFQLPRFPLRVIATTTRDLFELARADAFNADLTCFFSIMKIDLPPIEERTEDIPLLAQAILEKRNPKRDKQVAGFDSAAMQLLTEFRWPGNLDQLSSVIRDAVGSARSSLLNSDDLPKGFHDALSAQRIGRPVETVIELDAYLASIEKELLIRALRTAKGNKTKAAKLLSINRAKLLRRLQYFSIEIAVEFEPVDDSETPDFVEPDAFEEID